MDRERSASGYRSHAGHDGKVTSTNRSTKKKEKESAVTRSSSFDFIRIGVRLIPSAAASDTQDAKSDAQDHHARIVRTDTSSVLE